MALCCLFAVIVDVHLLPTIYLQTQQATLPHPIYIYRGTNFRLLSFKHALLLLILLLKVITVVYPFSNKMCDKVCKFKKWRILNTSPPIHTSPPPQSSAHSSKVVYGFNTNLEPFWDFQGCIKTCLPTLGCNPYR